MKLSVFALKVSPCQRPTSLSSSWLRGQEDSKTNSWRHSRRRPVWFHEKDSYDNYRTDSLLCANKECQLSNHFAIC